MLDEIQPYCEWHYRWLDPPEVLFFPSSHRPDESLRVCVHPGPSCCTSKMEDSYMAAVRSETQQKMRSYSFELKYMIAGHTKAYQGEGEKDLAKGICAPFWLLHLGWRASINRSVIWSQFHLVVSNLFYNYVSLWFVENNNVLSFWAPNHHKYLDNSSRFITNHKGIKSSFLVSHIVLIIYLTTITVWFKCSTQSNLNSSGDFSVWTALSSACSLLSFSLCIFIMK